MKKKLAILLIIVMAAVMVFGVAGCGSSNSSSTQSAEPTQDQKDAAVQDAVKSYISGIPSDYNLIGATKFKTDVVDKKDPNVQIVDLRAKVDFDKGHVEGAISDQFGKDFDMSKISKDKKVYVYCYSGQTAAMALTSLKIAGYQNVISVAGGSGMEGAEKAPVNFTKAGIQLVK